MKKILLILMAFFITSAKADVLDNCLKTIATDESIWQNMLFDKTNGVFSFLEDNDELTDEIVQSNKQKIYALLAKGVELKCADKIAQIAKITGRKEIPFQHNNKKYAFDFDIATMFDYTNEIRVGFLVINKRNLSNGDIVKVSDFPHGQKFFPDECSDWVIFGNLADDAAVNVAGQAVFNEFGGTKNEFFLDFAEGDNRRAFPGLVLMDKTLSSKETIVSYRNPNIGLQKYIQFAEKLKNSPCSNSGLAVYLVALDVKKDSTNTTTGSWAIGLTSAGAAGAATAGIALWAGAATSATVPVVGWIAAGVLATAGAMVAMIPETIELIDNVMILDGPYNL